MTTEEQKKADEAKAAAEQAAADKAASDKAAAEKAEADKKVKEDADKKGGADKSTMNAMLEKVRKQEKDKLYPKIEKLEAELKEGAKALQEMAAKLAAAEQEKQDLTNGKVTAQDVLKKQMDEQAKAMDKLRVDLEVGKKEALMKIQSAELKAFREQKLREAGADLIPELVMGNTEEEIVASLEKSKAKYQEVYQTALDKEKTKQPPPAGAGKTNPPAGAGSGGKKEYTQQEISKMSLEEYKAKRQEILGSLKAAG